MVRQGLSGVMLVFALILGITCIITVMLATEGAVPIPIWATKFASLYLGFGIIFLIAKLMTDESSN